MKKDGDLVDWECVPPSDWNSILETREGLPVRIYAVDGSGNVSIHGAIKHDYGWVITHWNRNGWWTSNILNNNDLVLKKRKFRYEHWINVYPDYCSGEYYPHRRLADSYASGDRIACVKVIIEGTEGDGL